MRRLTALAAVAASLGLTTGASAAPPPNDEPAAAVDLTTFTAENGEPSELQGSADVSEATPDTGVPRCLGPASFERTAWFRLPAADTPRRVRIAAPTKAGEPSELADLAAFVQPSSGANTAEPQACDGPESSARGGLLDGSPTVVLHVPAHQAVLVQAGWPAGSTAKEVLVTADATPLKAATEPPGDRATAAPRLRLGRLAALPLAGALLTEEDPAQPACPAAATVWRKLRVTRSGGHVAVASGASVTALTAFVGKAPTGEGAIACAVRGRRAELRTAFRARKGRLVWLRVGTDAAASEAAGLVVTASQERTRARRR
jgi:hypothetical protein